MLITSAAALLLAMVQPQWEALTSDQSGRYSIDPASIKSEGDDRMSVRSLVTLATAMEGAKRMEMQVVVDCGDRTFAFLAGKTFDAQGNQLHERTTPLAEAEFQAIQADTVEAAVQARICPRR